jgi:hypothetical protein
MFTLVAVEAPQIIVPAPWTDKKSDDEDEAPPQVQQERSITKSIRTTVRHLYGVGGPFAMCRGLALDISLHIAAFAVATPMFMFWFLRSFGKEDEEPLPNFSEMALSARLKEVLVGFAFEIAGNLFFCSWMAAWVHIVMTQHTLRIWYRRIPPFVPTFRATWRPLVILPVVDILFRDTMVVLLKHTMGLYSAAETPESTFTSRNMLLTLVWLLSQAIRLLVSLPLEVAVVRIQASLLSEDEEPIVPFDRSFGNNGPNGLRPGLLAEPRGPLSLRQAWRSLTWTELRRLFKIFAKMLAVQAVVNAVFWLAIGNKVWPQHWVPTRV